MNGVVEKSMTMSSSAFRLAASAGSGSRSKIELAGWRYRDHFFQDAVSIFEGIVIHRRFKKRTMKEYEQYTTVWGVDCIFYLFDIQMSGLVRAWQVNETAPSPACSTSSPSIPQTSKWYNSTNIGLNNIKKRPRVTWTQWELNPRPFTVFIEMMRSELLH